ncbi:MAG: polyprenyl synthetase family protein [Niastella sp.]|nr:polyprenyl synthetase family protein [Niastella sp.]
MKSFAQISSLFEEKFNRNHFPAEPAKLYQAAQYVLGIGGKRVRPACVLMTNELFAEINEDTFHVAMAVELFHNFTLVHDDIMDKAPIRRGLPTVHEKFGESTAILAGDVLFAQAYDYLMRIKPVFLQPVLRIFTKTAKEVCEGQQLDMDFEQKSDINMDEYVQMITLKTSVLLAASMQLGAILGGAGAGNQDQLYEFGKYLGIAFQVQDDYLDTFGDPQKFGKQIGGDILCNKKTFLWLYAMEVASAGQKDQLLELSKNDDPKKVEKVTAIYKMCEVDAWATSLKKKYLEKALFHLDEVAVQKVYKEELNKIALHLMQRES